MMTPWIRVLLFSAALCEIYFAPAKHFGSQVNLDSGFSLGTIKTGLLMMGL